MRRFCAEFEALPASTEVVAMTATFTLLLPPAFVSVFVSVVVFVTASVIAVTVDVVVVSAATAVTAAATITAPVVGL